MEQKKSDYRVWKYVLVLTAAALLLLVDRVTKQLVLAYLKPIGSYTVIGGLLEFSYLENTGAAFGLFQGRTWVLVLITLAAFAVMLIGLFRYRKHTFFSYSTVALLMAGGVGNLLDRLQYRFVVDFIHVMFFDYVFNFADCCITVGAVLFVLHVFLSSKKEKREQSVSPPQDETL